MRFKTQFQSFNRNFLAVIMKKIRFFSTFAVIAFLFLLSGCNNAPDTSIETFDGVKLVFDNTGKGEPAIIFVPGWTNPKEIWDAQVSYFSAKHQVIAVDLPGFGESGNNRSNWTMESYGNDIVEIIQKLELNKVILVGFSMGAPVVIEAAANAPDQVIGVVLVDDLQDVEMTIPPPVAAFLDSMMMDLVLNLTKEGLVSNGFFMHNIDSSYQRLLTLYDGASHIGWHESLVEYMNWINESCVDAIGAVKAPIVAINSAMQPTNVAAFRKYSPGFEAKIIENVGHMIMWDDTEEFNRLLEETIEEFLED